MRSLSLKEARTRTWDVIVIGAGMGGGLVGRRLAERDLSVLFIEKGPTPPNSEMVIGYNVQHPAARLLRGFWPKPMEARLDGQVTQFYGGIGAGVGGSSVFYAASLERPERHDLDEHPSIPHPTGGWPIGFDSFNKYFDQASAILSICGTPDPLSKEPEIVLGRPKPVPDGDRALMEEMKQHGLHPYSTHLGLRWPERCQACFGFKCPYGCKMDGRSAGVVPAIEQGAALLDLTEVTEIIENGKSVNGLRVRRDGEESVITASTYVLAAGSLGSARLLLASNSRIAQGVANSSGWVGRGLMFHLNEFFLLWPRRSNATSFSKSISLRDLYCKKNMRFGLVQSLGMGATYENMVGYMNQIYDQSPLRRYPKFRGVTRVPALLMSTLFGEAAAFVGIMEDLPYPENRVVLHEDDQEILTFEYKMHAELRSRRRAFRRELKRAFRNHKRFMVSIQPMLNYGHPVGTLRFGVDPSNSVLRPDCRAHDLGNLYVADGSFMPTSLGVNPSLMIAANALRVGDCIANEHGGTQDVAVR